MRFPSRSIRRLAVAAAIGAVLLPFPVLPTLAGGGNVIIPEGRVEEEDFYALGGRVIVEGVIEGDLVAGAGELIVTGRVEGDVLALVTGKATIGGEIGGSVRVAARDLVVDGHLEDDLAAATIGGKMRGRVGRDVLMAAMTTSFSGTADRDLRGQFWRLEIDGTVGRNVNVTVQGLRVTASAEVGGDLTYHSNSEADLSAGAVLEGQVVKRRARVPLQVRTIRRLVNLLSVLAFIVTGVVLFWLLRRSLPRATTAVVRMPMRTLLIGIGAMVVAPLAALALAITLVGLPLAALILVLWLAALFLGPIPSVTAAADKALQGRVGLIGAFIVGALVWRGAVWLIPFVGSVLYLAAVMWGVGAWLVGAWEARRDQPGTEAPSLTRPPPQPPEPPEEWEAPLPPVAPPPGEAAEPEDGERGLDPGPGSDQARTGKDDGPPGPAGEGVSEHGSEKAGGDPDGRGGE